MMSEQREQGEQRRCECGACWWDGKDWLVRSCVETRDMSVCGEYAVQHCPGCGCRLSVEAGQPRVGEAYAVLQDRAERLAALITPHIKGLYHTDAHFNVCAATLRSLLLDWRVTPREIAWRYRDAIVDVQESMMLACALFLCVPQLVAVDEQRNDVKPIERLTELAALISGRDADALGGETDGE